MLTSEEEVQIVILPEASHNYNWLLNCRGLVQSKEVTLEVKGILWFMLSNQFGKLGQYFSITLKP